ncbi:hypothetical protein [Paraburkholderia youngii]|uniref:hypothetical protein n=1 Tax=Paraburkholderia youngii TaxID=2782701 RepID=UPI003D1A11C3
MYTPRALARGGADEPVRALEIYDESFARALTRILERTSSDWALLGEVQQIVVAAVMEVVD